MGALCVIFIVVIIFLFVKGENHDRKVEREQTQTCGHCGMTIPYMAAECPYCHRKPGVDFRSVASVGKKSSGMAFAKICLLLMAVLLGLMVLFAKGGEIVSSLGGGSSSTCKITLTDCDYTGIDNDDIEITFLHLDEDGEDASGTFDDDGKLSLKLSNGRYWMSSASKDMLKIDVGYDYEFSGGKSTYDFSPVLLYYHMIELKFYDGSGAELSPENVSLYFPETDETVSVNIGDHYFAYMYADTTAGSVQIQADDYDIVTVSYEEMTGVNTLTVVLDSNDGESMWDSITSIWDSNDVESMWENGSDEIQVILGEEYDESLETELTYVAVNRDSGEVLEGTLSSGYADVVQMAEGTWEITAEREGYESKSIELEINDDYMLYWLMFTLSE